MRRRRVRAADLFCGGGGTSTGLAYAVRDLGEDVDLELLAINHWDIAIQTHSANHPAAEHRCENLDNVDPRKAVPEGRLDLLVASPECTHHSNARGGVPMSDQSRASAWHVLRWAEALYIDAILVENVREFMDWGPLGASGRPLKSQRGATFQAWVNALRSLGYAVDYRVLCAANYGDPTTRERLFVLARRGRKAIKWPEPTHLPAQKAGAFDCLPWRAAREIIDWSIQGRSIFDRKKPLRDTTLRRIEAGLRKFGGPAAEPFLVVLRRNGDARSIQQPLPTITAGGNHIGLCEPFVVQTLHGKNDTRSHSVEEPMPTLTTMDAWAVVEPFVLPMNRTKDNPIPVDRPMNTITATSADYGLVEPFIIGVGGPTGTARPQKVSEPLKTVLSQDRRGVVEPFLVKFYGTGVSQSVEEPLDTVTAKDRFGLVETEGGEKYQIDIRFRMLQPHELAAAMSFPQGYQFAGTREEQVRQIGNAVAVQTARALCRELLA